MNIEQLMGALGAPPEPAAPVLTMPATLAERIAEKLSGIDLHGSELSELRVRLAMPIPQLWAIHSPGPGETHPCLDREDAEKQSTKIADYVEKTVGERPAVNVIPSPWEPAEHFEIMASEWLEDAEQVRQKAISLQASVIELEAMIAQCRQFAAEVRPAGKILMAKKTALIERIDAALSGQQQKEASNG